MSTGSTVESCNTVQYIVCICEFNHIYIINFYQIACTYFDTNLFNKYKYFIIGSVSQDFLHLFFSWFEPIRAPDKQAKISSTVILFEFCRYIQIVKQLLSQVNKLFQKTLQCAWHQTPRCASYRGGRLRGASFRGVSQSEVKLYTLSQNQTLCWSLVALKRTV